MNRGIRAPVFLRQQEVPMFVIKATFWFNDTLYAVDDMGQIYRWQNYTPQPKTEKRRDGVWELVGGINLAR